MSAARENARQKRLEKINSEAPEFGKIQFMRSVPFGTRLTIDCFKMQNGLDILLLTDKSAPVIAFHAWFNVGSRNERPGKTGISHLFEHLMFNEVEGLPPGEFDRRMEAAGADNNASTWLDFTQYQEAFPKEHLGMVVDLEGRRMGQLVLREAQLKSEIDVVKNERRFRVEDDVEGTVQELLWKTAFTKHSYHWPTLGWMNDIGNFTTEDCLKFYRSYYAPNNASIILVGDLNEAQALKKLSQAYGTLPSSELPLEDIHPEPVQTEERIVELTQPTETEKVAIGYKGPALGDVDHVTATLLVEILTGGPASRLERRLVRNDKVASEVSGFVGPHRDPSLIEFSASAREGTNAQQLLACIDEELQRVVDHPVSDEEIARARARTELSLLGGLETADGKASTIGFYQTLLGRPAAAFERLDALNRITRSDLQLAARRYLIQASRTVILVHPQTEESPSASPEELK